MAQPLPAGWEARFDAGSGRYYFINHYNKQTTWVDPRGAAQPQAANQSAQYSGYSQQQQQSSYQQQQQMAYAQQQQQQRAEAERRAESERQAEAARRQAEAARRQAETERQEAEAARSYREQLHDRSPSLSSSSHSQEAEISRGGGGSGGYTLGDSSDMVSDSDKQQMSNQLKNLLDLEGVADDLILMTLDGVMYNVDMAVQVFQSMGFKKKGESGTTVASTSEDRWETVTPLRGKTKEKKATDETESTSATASTQPIPSLPEISSQPIPTLSDTTFGQGITFDELDSKFKPGGSTLFDALTPDQGSDILSKMTSATDASVRSMFSDSSATGGKFEATPSPSVSTYTLQDKVGSVGADRGLARGSDPRLLSNAHVVCKGADVKLSVGAQRGLARGQSKLANGANKHLAKGADRDLCVGRNPALAKGPQRGV